MVEGFLDAIRPDYVQFDCKGHQGYASYPTEVGYAAPGLGKDGLEIWRRGGRSICPREAAALSSIETGASSGTRDADLSDV